MGNPVKVLHLEDSEIDHRLLVRAVRESGLQAQFLRLDEQAAFMDALHTQSFDIILMDFRLPGFTALEAWSEVQSLPSHPPCVIVSGAIGEQAAVNAIQTGISDYLHKDRIAEIGRVIQRAMHLHKTEEERIKVQQALSLSEQRIRELARHLQTSLEAERAAISREIHDDIGGSLTALKLDLAWIKRHSEHQPTLTRLVAAEEMLSLALAATQRIMQNTRPAILDQGLSACVEWLVAGHSRRTGKTVNLINDLTSEALPDAFRLAAYRIVQEALTNAGKYAPESDVSVEVSDAGGTLTIEIRDSGPGFELNRLQSSRGFGLKGLSERAESIGGWLDISSTPKRGTSITLTAPLSWATDNRQGDSRE